MSDKSLKPGPTGRFPLGKMAPNDEGELLVAVRVGPGKVVLDFGKPIAWLGMEPEQAEHLAAALKDNARKARIQ